MVKIGHQVLTACLLLSPLRLHAGLADAKAAYLKGVQLESAKNYVAALACYKTALAELPTYVYADRQLANCYYYLGDIQDAARECGIYLAAKPDDAQVRAFAQRLVNGGELSPEVRQGLGPIGDEAPPYQNSLYMGLSFAEVIIDKGDVQQLSPGSQFLDETGTMENFKVGVLLKEGFWFEGSFVFGPDRSYTPQGAVGPGQFSLNLSELSVSVEPGFRFPLSDKISLGAGVAMGYAQGSLLYTPVGGVAEEYVGSGFVYTPEIKLSLVLEKVGFDIDAGYHNSQLSPMKDVNGYPLTVADLGTGIDENWTMDNSGYFLRMGLLYYFNSPMSGNPLWP